MNPPIGTKGLPKSEHKEFLSELNSLEITVYGNTYHFYEVASALALKLYSTHGVAHEIETEDLIFKQMRKRAMKMYPQLKQEAQYSSCHVAATLFIQRRFKEKLQRIRERNIDKEPFSPDNFYNTDEIINRPNSS